MNCKGTITLYMGMNYDRPHTVKCGTTGPGGSQLLCSRCTEENNEIYPQGWRFVPGDMCVHGTYLGDRHGPDLMCAYCEQGD